MARLRPRSRRQVESDGLAGAADEKEAGLEGMRPRSRSSTRCRHPFRRRRFRSTRCRDRPRPYFGFPLVGQGKELLGVYLEFETGRLLVIGDLDVEAVLVEDGREDRVLGAPLTRFAGSLPGAGRRKHRVVALEPDLELSCGAFARVSLRPAESQSLGSPGLHPPDHICRIQSEPP